MTTMSDAALPLRVTGRVVKGFGRGSKELGVPTANLDKAAVDSASHLHTGVYYGFARVGNSDEVHKAVTSVGWNPQYGNEEKSVEVHILHAFQEDFYGEHLRFIFLGFLRDEQKFDSLDALISQINLDIENGRQELNKFQKYVADPFFGLHISKS